MLGKYGEASSSSMINLENGIRNRMLYHQNMMGVNLVAEFYHNSPIAPPGSGGSAMQAQKMLTGSGGGGGGGVQQQQSLASANGADGGMKQPQYQCHVCQKIFVSLAVLTQHAKTHENEYRGRLDGGGAGAGAVGYSSGVPQGGATVPTSSPNLASPPLIQQHHIKSEFVTPTSGQFQTYIGKQFECHICHKSFMTMVNLNLHMKIHESELKAAQMYQTNLAGQNYHLAASATAAAGGNAAGMKVELCQICHKTFSSMEQFSAHMKIHENEFKNRALYHSNGVGCAPEFYPNPPQPVAQPMEVKGHRCPICHKMSDNIIEHIKQHEGQLTGAGSSGGGGGIEHHYQDESQSSLEDDGEQSADPKHECLICHKKFSTSGNLAIHIRVHSGEKPFKCSVCGKGFIQSNNLATHMKTHTGEKPYSCTICGKNFSQSNNLKTHIRTHTGEKPYACTICGKRFNQKNNLTTHMRTHQLVCMFCGVQFMHPTDLANHMKFHNDEKPYICSVCNKVYLNLDELTEHMKKTHNQVKPYRCHICEKTFTQSNNLKTHIKTHIFQDPYKCQMCSRSFQKEDDFSQHMLVHTADKPYECTYCGKRFIQSNNLKTHVRTHTGEKPYKCSICAKHFNQKNNLNTHMRIHTGEKPFECTICDKRFNQSNNLNKHIKTHGQEKDQPGLS